MVVGDQRKPEVAHAALGQRERDQPARTGRHEVDRLGRRALRGNEQIAFVLAVFVVDQNQHAAFAHVRQHLFDDELAGFFQLTHLN